MELEKIYKIIDDTVKDMKKHCFQDGDDLDMINELSVFCFCMALKEQLKKEADKNEH